MSVEGYLTDAYLRYLRGGTFDSQFGSRWKEHDQAQKVFESAFFECLVDLGFLARFDNNGIVVGIIEGTISRLKQSGGIEVEGDEFTGEFWRLVVPAKDSFIDQFFNSDPISIRVRRLGKGAQKIALAKIATDLAWSEISDEDEFDQGSDGATTEEQAANIWVIPASDRVVLRSDNQPQVDEIHGVISEIRKELTRDNQIGDAIGDDREVIDLELQVAEKVVEGSKFRLSSLMGWLLPALRYLADKFAGSAISESAKYLWNLLVSLF